MEHQLIDRPDRLTCPPEGAGTGERRPSEPEAAMRPAGGETAADSCDEGRDELEQVVGSRVDLAGDEQGHDHEHEQDSGSRCQRSQSRKEWHLSVLGSIPASHEGFGGDGRKGLGQLPSKWPEASPCPAGSAGGPRR